VSGHQLPALILFNWEFLLIAGYRYFINYSTDVNDETMYTMEMRRLVFVTVRFIYSFNNSPVIRNSICGDEEYMMICLLIEQWFCFITLFKIVSTPLMRLPYSGMGMNRFAARFASVACCIT
jgi:hypothetical protein